MAFVSYRGMSQSAEKLTTMVRAMPQLSLAVVTLVVKMVIKIMGL
jgi:hypothetical protein